MTTSSRDQRERGQVLAIFALGLVAIIAMTGLVIDGGSTFVQRRDMQNVADAAAMAGAYDYANTGSSSSAIAAARSVAQANGYGHGAGGVVVDVVVDTSGGGTTVQVSVGKPHRNHFSGIVGMPSWEVSTTATAITGAPNAAIGAAPLIFNTVAFPGAINPNTPVSFSEPNPGSQDVPQSNNQFNWTVYCTAQGQGHGGCNANSDAVRDLIKGTNKNGKEITLENDIGPLNAGSHATLYSALAELVGQEFPVAIVDNQGNFKGIAMFHLTGSVGGSTKKIEGYFLDTYSGDQLKIKKPNAAGTVAYGTYRVYLED